MPRFSADRLARMQASPQYRNGKFANIGPMRPPMEGSSFSLMRELLFGGKKRTPRRPLPIESPVRTWAAPSATGLRVTWLGHSSLFIECDGARILTDPVFGQNASPVSFAGRKRFHPVPATIQEMQPIDVVLLSHDHYDHLCRPTIRQLAKLDVPFVTSLGVGERLEKFGVGASRITELDWWESYALPNREVTLTATPAQHFSGRSLTDRNATLWSSWAIAGDRHKIFFSADTGLNDDLRRIGERFGPFDLAMLEIGASHPAWADIHLGPANALRALEMLGGGTMLPIHWGTFDLALHSWEEPAETLTQLALKLGARVITPPLGRPIEPAIPAEPTPWWRDIGG